MNIQDTLNERGSRYGDFSDHARIAQSLQKVMQEFQLRDQSRLDKHGELPYPWDGLSDVQKQALTVIADKIARILSGDPNYADNWHDIQGYARLVEERLPVQEVTGDGSGEALPTIGELLEPRICTCGSTVDGQPIGCHEHPGKPEVIVQLKRLGELDVRALKTLRTSCDAELLRKQADRLQGRYHG